MFFWLGSDVHAGLLQSLSSHRISLLLPTHLFLCRLLSPSLSLPPCWHTAATRARRTAINLTTEQHRQPYYPHPVPAHTRPSSREQQPARNSDDNENNPKGFPTLRLYLSLLPESPSFLGRRYSLMASHFREQLSPIIRQTNELKNESMQTERAGP